MSEIVDPGQVRRRWDEIRRQWKLSLSPEAVAETLRVAEKDVVRERILETLVQLAKLRVAEKEFHSFTKEAAAGGDLATCEGLETFLVPAVEGALSVSAVLDALPANNCSAQAFADKISADIQGLLKAWSEDDRFSGAPYADETRILNSLQAIHRQEIRKVDVVEGAAMACRVATHLLTLKLVRPDEGVFRKWIGDRIGDEHLFAALVKAVKFLIQSFQRGSGQTEEQRIAAATFSSRGTARAGSGWSWTDWQGLPPMLFFTAAAVDAFAEIDLYIIRVATMAESTQDAAGQKKIAAFYEKHIDTFAELQLCVDMARRWVAYAALPSLSLNEGVHAEPDITLITKDGLKTKDQLAGMDVREMPTLLYNNLYGLQILLWGWADRNETGDGMNEDIANKINRALGQLVYNYGLPAVKQGLMEMDYVLSLPGKEFERGKDAERPYLDSGFLPLLTRLLVLFVLYGVGDRIMLEPVIRNLYVELLQNRLRTNWDYTALWAATNIEIFSTQRAVQALTFYYSYAAGKEMAGGGTVGGGGGDFVVWRNKTNLPLIIEASLERPIEIQQPQVPPPPPLPDPRSADKFGDYCKKVDPNFAPAPDAGNTNVQQLQTSIYDDGNSLFKALKAGKVRDAGLATSILYMFVRITQSPIRNEKVRSAEFAALAELARDIAPEADWRR